MVAWEKRQMACWKRLSETCSTFWEIQGRASLKRLGLKYSLMFMAYACDQAPD